ncbi:MAG: GNAT family N-acetyltransferase [Bauldia sp.]|nr:GNAT family N-acetyltransferase [Bauldia sp.]
MSHVLDRPVWNALRTRHAALAEGGPLARRYPPAVIPFGAARDDSDESLRALAALLAPDDTMMMAEAGPLATPPGLAVQASATVVQMILTRPLPAGADDRIARLGEADAEEMLALATLCRPGPFTLRAQALGEFHGIRIDGRLAAMAGTRMRQEGHAEISGVSTHPDFRGRGLARVLSVFMASRFLDAGDTPYLHAYATNAAAIGLYESIGFEIRTTLNVAVVARAA